jgi:MFS transporter, UMF1 family
MSGAADHGRFRKTFLLAFAFTGAIATALFIGIVPQIYLIGGLLAIISNTCFGASFVLLNSFLPLLVRYHPTIQSSCRIDRRRPTDDYVEQEDNTMTSSRSGLMPRDTASLGAADHGSAEIISPELKLSTRISSYGIGIGYLAGLFVQCLAIGIVVLTGSTLLSLRLVLLLIGTWWFVFSVPAAMWLRPRPGPPLPSELTGRYAWISYVIYAWKSLFKTIGHARKLKDIVIFLCAWFLLSDSIATVSGTAVLFAKTSLGMSTQALGLINVIATVAGVLGAFYWSFISRILNLRASRTIVACICLFEIIPLYGLLGFIPAIQRYGVFGLQQPWESKSTTSIAFAFRLIFSQCTHSAQSTDLSSVAFHPIAEHFSANSFHPGTKRRSTHCTQLQTRAAVSSGQPLLELSQIDTARFGLRSCS